MVINSGFIFVSEIMCTGLCSGLTKWETHSVLTSHRKGSLEQIVKVWSCAAILENMYVNNLCIAGFLGHMLLPDLRNRTATLVGEFLNFPSQDASQQNQLTLRENRIFQFQIFQQQLYQNHSNANVLVYLNEKRCPR